MRRPRAWVVRLREHAPGNQGTRLRGARLLRAPRRGARAGDGGKSAPAFEAAATAFAAGGSLRQIRAAATRGYAEGQRRPVNHDSGVFTNPSDRRWERR